VSLRAWQGHKVQLLADDHYSIRDGAFAGRARFDLLFKIQVRKLGGVFSSCGERTDGNAMIKKKHRTPLREYTVS